MQTIKTQKEERYLASKNDPNVLEEKDDILAELKGLFWL